MLKSIGAAMSLMADNNADNIGSLSATGTVLLDSTVIYGITLQSAGDITYSTYLNNAVYKTITINTKANGNVVIDQAIDKSAVIASAITVSANGNVNVNANLTFSGASISFIADANSDGYGAFIQAAGTLIKTIGSGDITINSSSNATIYAMTSAGALSVYCTTVVSGNLSVNGNLISQNNTDLRANNDLTLNGNITLTTIGYLKSCSLLADYAGNNAGILSTVSGNPTINTTINGTIALQSAGDITTSVYLAGAVFKILTVTTKGNAGIIIDQDIDKSSIVGSSLTFNSNGDLILSGNRILKSLGAGMTLAADNNGDNIGALSATGTVLLDASILYGITLQSAGDITTSTYLTGAVFKTLTVNTKANARITIDQDFDKSLVAGSGLTFQSNGDLVFSGNRSLRTIGGLMTIKADYNNDNIGSLSATGTVLLNASEFYGIGLQSAGDIVTSTYLAGAVFKTLVINTKANAKITIDQDFIKSDIAGSQLTFQSNGDIVFSGNRIFKSIGAGMQFNADDNADNIGSLLATGTVLLDSSLAYGITLQSAGNIKTSDFLTGAIFKTLTISTKANASITIDQDFDLSNVPLSGLAFQSFGDLVISGNRVLKSTGGWMFLLADYENSGTGNGMGSLSATGTVLLDSSVLYNITLQSAGDITTSTYLTGAVYKAVYINTKANANVTIDQAIDKSAITSSAITVSSNGNITVGASLTFNSFGTGISLSADANSDGYGYFTQAGGTLIKTITAGNINISSSNTTVNAITSAGEISISGTISTMSNVALNGNLICLNNMTVSANNNLTINGNISLTITNITNAKTCTLTADSNTDNVGALSAVGGNPTINVQLNGSINLRSAADITTSTYLTGAVFKSLTINTKGNAGIIVDQNFDTSAVYGGNLYFYANGDLTLSGNRTIKNSGGNIGLYADYNDDNLGALSATGTVLLDASTLGGIAISSAGDITTSTYLTGAVFKSVGIYSKANAKITIDQDFDKSGVANSILAFQSYGDLVLSGNRVIKTNSGYIWLIADSNNDNVGSLSATGSVLLDSSIYNGITLQSAGDIVTSTYLTGAVFQTLTITTKANAGVTIDQDFDKSLLWGSWFTFYSNGNINMDGNRVLKCVGSGISLYADNNSDGVGALSATGTVLLDCSLSQGIALQSAGDITTSTYLTGAVFKYLTVSTTKGNADIIIDQDFDKSRVVGSGVSFYAYGDIILSGNRILKSTGRNMSLSADYDADGIGSLSATGTVLLDSSVLYGITLQSAGDITTSTYLTGAIYKTLTINTKANANVTIDQAIDKSAITGSAITVSSYGSITVGGNLTFNGADLSFAADNNSDGVGNFTQSPGTLIKTITSGYITVTSSGDATFYDISSMGQVYLSSNYVEMISNLTINGNLASIDNITLSAKNNLTVNGAVNITMYGTSRTLSISADSDSDGAGALTFTGIPVLNAQQSGKVLLQSAGDMTTSSYLGSATFAALTMYTKGNAKITIDQSFDKSAIYGSGLSFYSNGDLVLSGNISLKCFGAGAGAGDLTLIADNDNNGIGALSATGTVLLNCGKIRTLTIYSSGDLITSTYLTDAVFRQLSLAARGEASITVDQDFDKSSVYGSSVTFAAYGNLILSGNRTIKTMMSDIALYADNNEDGVGALSATGTVLLNSSVGASINIMSSGDILTSAFLTNAVFKTLTVYTKANANITIDQDMDKSLVVGSAVTFRSNGNLILSGNRILKCAGAAMELKADYDADSLGALSATGTVLLDATPFYGITLQSSGDITTSAYLTSAVFKTLAVYTKTNANITIDQDFDKSLVALSGLSFYSDGNLILSGNRILKTTGASMNIYADNNQDGVGALSATGSVLLGATPSYDIVLYSSGDIRTSTYLTGAIFNNLYIYAKGNKNIEVDQSFDQSGVFGATIRLYATGNLVLSGNISLKTNSVNGIILNADNNYDGIGALSATGTVLLDTTTNGMISLSSAGDITTSTFLTGAVYKIISIQTTSNAKITIDQSFDLSAYMGSSISFYTNGDLVFSGNRALKSVGGNMLVYADYNQDGIGSLSATGTVLLDASPLYGIILQSAGDITASAYLTSAVYKTLSVTTTGSAKITIDQNIDKSAVYGSALTFYSNGDLVLSGNRILRCRGDMNLYADYNTDGIGSLSATGSVLLDASVIGVLKLQSSGDIISSTYLNNSVFKYLYIYTKGDAGLTIDQSFDKSLVVGSEFDFCINGNIVLNGDITLKSNGKILLYADYNENGIGVLSATGAVLLDATPFFGVSLQSAGDITASTYLTNVVCKSVSIYAFHNSDIILDRSFDLSSVAGSYFYFCADGDLTLSGNVTFKAIGSDSMLKADNNGDGIGLLSATGTVLIDTTVKYGIYLQSAGDITASTYLTNAVFKTLNVTTKGNGKITVDRDFDNSGTWNSALNFYSNGDLVLSGNRILKTCGNTSSTINLYADYDLNGAGALSTTGTIVLKALSKGGIVLASASDITTSTYLTNADFTFLTVLTRGNAKLTLDQSFDKSAVYGSYFTMMSYGDLILSGNIILKTAVGIGNGIQLIADFDGNGIGTLSATGTVLLDVTKKYSLQIQSSGDINTSTFLTNAVYKTLYVTTKGTAKIFVDQDFDKSAVWQSALAFYSYGDLILSGNRVLKTMAGSIGLYADYDANGVGALSATGTVLLDASVASTITLQSAGDITTSTYLTGAVFKYFSIYTKGTASVTVNQSFDMKSVAGSSLIFQSNGDLIFNGNITLKAVNGLTLRADYDGNGVGTLSKTGTLSLDAGKMYEIGLQTAGDLTVSDWLTGAIFHSYSAYASGNLTADVDMIATAYMYLYADTDNNGVGNLIFGDSVRIVPSSDNLSVLIQGANSFTLSTLFQKLIRRGIQEMTLTSTAGDITVDVYLPRINGALNYKAAGNLNINENIVNGYSVVTLKADNDATGAGNLIFADSKLVSITNATSSSSSLTFQGANALTTSGILGHISLYSNATSWPQITVISTAGNVTVDQSLFVNGATLEAAGNLAVNRGIYGIGSVSLKADRDSSGAGLLSFSGGYPVTVAAYSSSSTSTLTLQTAGDINTGTLLSNITGRGRSTMSITSTSGAVNVDSALSFYRTISLSAANGINQTANLESVYGGVTLNADNDASGAGAYTMALGTTLSADYGQTISITASGASTLRNIPLCGSLAFAGATAAATFDAGTYTFTLGNNLTFSNNAVFVPGTSTIVFDGGYNKITSNSQSLGNVTVNDPTSYVELQDNADLNGSLTLTSGVFTANNKNMAVGGDWANSATFNQGTGKVTFDTAGVSIISGSNTFYDLACETAGKTLTFTRGTTQTVTNSLTITGTSGSPVIINDTGAGAVPKLTLNAGKTQSINNVRVTNNDASGGQTLTAYGSSSLAGTTNWAIGFVGDTYTWTGAVSADWNTGGNWDSGQVPSATSKVIIPSGTPNQPALAGAVTVTSLTINSGDTLTTNSNSLTVTEWFVNNGTLAAGSSSVSVSGSITGSGSIAGVNPRISAGGIIGTLSSPIGINVTGVAFLTASNMSNLVSISVTGGPCAFAGGVPGFIYQNGDVLSQAGQYGIRAQLETAFAPLFEPSALPAPVNTGCVPAILLAPMPQPSMGLWNMLARYFVSRTPSAPSPETLPTLLPPELGTDFFRVRYMPA